MSGGGGRRCIERKAFNASAAEAVEANVREEEGVKEEEEDREVAAAAVDKRDDGMEDPSGDRAE